MFTKFPTQTFTNAVEMPKYFCGFFVFDLNDVSLNPIFYRKFA